MSQELHCDDDYFKTPSLTTSTSNGSKTGRAVKHRRRYCRVEGCERIVKSQGVCQRHGAKPKRCKVAGCNKQAQGSFDRMCKAHFKAAHDTDSTSQQDHESTNCSKLHNKLERMKPKEINERNAHSWANNDLPGTARFNTSDTHIRSHQEQTRIEENGVKGKAKTLYARRISQGDTIGDETAANHNSSEILMRDEFSPLSLPTEESEDFINENLINEVSEVVEETSRMTSVCFSPIQSEVSAADVFEENKFPVQRADKSWTQDCGVLNHMEQTWRHDVGSSFHARELRQSYPDEDNGFCYHEQSNSGDRKSRYHYFFE